jgi:hypothetical protein
MSVPEREALISREEVIATLFLLADIATDVRTIRGLLEENGEEEEDQ